MLPTSTTTQFIGRLQRRSGVLNESVKTAVADGLCACEHLNPTGKCCLPAIRPRAPSKKN